ncbi:MAG: hypothetical protein HY721_15010 [Planctomycetes bacterium]|nr:hypothetical protein [Planctomycetota bacterium]
MTRNLATNVVARSLAPRPLAAGLRPPVLVSLSLLAAQAMLSAQAQETLLIAVGDEWSYFKGTEEPPVDWNALGFDDSDWLTGPTGIGYGDQDDATVLTDMQNGYASIFCRRVFRVPDPGALDDLTLRITYDDGFVAYLNGVEVARSPNMGVPGDPVAHTAFATAGHDALASESFALDPGVLQAGDNVLAVQVHNVNLGSSDLTFLPELVVNASFCIQRLACSFTAGSGVTLTWFNAVAYDSLAVQRNGSEIARLFGTDQQYLDPDPPAGEVTYSVVAVLGVESCASPDCQVRVFAPEDILIFPGDEWRFFRGSSAPPADWSQESFDDGDWETGPTGIGYGDGDDLTVLDDMTQRADDPLTPEDEFRPGYLAVFARKDFRVADPAAVDSLVLSIVYDDGFVAYLNGKEIGRANVPAGDATETTAALAATEPGAPAQVTVAAGQVKAGRNVLAVSVHNANLTSSDLSFIPVLAKVPRGGPVDPLLLRGNADGQGGVNLTDAVFILRFLFQGGTGPTCIDAADADDSGILNLTDALAILRSLFQGSGPLPEPFPACGPDPTADGLAECVASGC